MKMEKGRKRYSETTEEAATGPTKRNRAEDGERNRACSSKLAVPGHHPLVVVPPAHPQEPHLPPPPPQKIQLFIRTNFCPGTLALHASPDDTILSVLACARARLHVSPSTADQWLLFGGKSLQLQPAAECTLADSGILRDSTLHLVQRMRSTALIESWNLAMEVVHACSKVARVSSLPPGRDSRLAHRCHIHLEHLVLNFHNKLLKSFPLTVCQHVEILDRAGAAKSLAMLYCSSDFLNSYCATRCMEILLTGWKDCSEWVLLFHALGFSAPLLLQLCKHIGKMRPQHIKDRIEVAALLDKYGGACFHLMNASKIIHSIAPVVHQISLYIHQNWGNHCADDSEESFYSIPFDYCCKNFVSFLIPLCQALERGTSVSAFTVEIGSPGWLKTIFEKHLEDLHIYFRCFCNVETLRKACPPAFLKFLKALYIMAGVCTDGMAALHSLFQSHAPLLNVLIGKLQFKEGDNTWIIEFKSYLQPDTRKDLALSLLPVVKRSISGSRHLINVRRSALLHDSFKSLAYLGCKKLQRGISVKFSMEEATGPGVLREWFSLICKEIFNPANTLFKSCPKDRRRVFPNPNSGVNPKHLKYFEFCGRVIALALMHNIEIDTVLDLAFFKQIAGLPVSWKDIQDADPELYKNWEKLLQMDAEYIDSDALALTFVAEVEQIGTHKTVELCTGGEVIQVNSRNRLEYVDMSTKCAFVTPIADQVKSFCQGFSDLLRYGSCFRFFQILQPEDLDSMLYGKDRDIDIEDWKAHTKYHGFKARDKHIKWFWKIVSEMNMEQRKKLLHFSTSISHLPVGGFAALPSRFHVFKSFSESTHFPTAHTCFYRLDLPLYPNFKIMQDRLHFVIEDGVYIGFGFI